MRLFASKMNSCVWTCNTRRCASQCFFGMNVPIETNVVIQNAKSHLLRLVSGVKAKTRPSRPKPPLRETAYSPVLEAVLIGGDLLVDADQNILLLARSRFLCLPPLSPELSQEAAGHGLYSHWVSRVSVSLLDVWCFAMLSEPFALTLQLPNRSASPRTESWNNWTWTAEVSSLKACCFLMFCQVFAGSWHLTAFPSLYPEVSWTWSRLSIFCLGYQSHFKKSGVWSFLCT